MILNIANYQETTIPRVFTTATMTKKSCLVERGFSVVSLFSTNAKNRLNVVKRGYLRLSVVDIAPDIGKLMTQHQVQPSQLFIVISSFRTLRVLDCMHDSMCVFVCVRMYVFIYSFE